MSSFVVSQNHIHTIATAAYQMGLVEGKDLDAFGRMLWSECVDSIAYRYGLTARNQELKAYRKAIKEYAFENKPAASVPVLKMALQCFDYQSCEHPGWVLSAARFACEAIDCRLGPVDEDELRYERVGWGID